MGIDSGHTGCGPRVRRVTELPLVERLRLDKWLWATRLFKTRALAAEAVERRRLRVNGQSAKPARELKAGDVVELRDDALWRMVEVVALSAIRGPAPLAQSLYRETAHSIAAREAAASLRRLAPEPAGTIRDGRPTKRDRRRLPSARVEPVPWRRWSASIDDDSGSDP